MISEGRCRLLLVALVLVYVVVCLYFAAKWDRQKRAADSSKHPSPATSKSLQPQDELRSPLMRFPTPFQYHHPRPSSKFLRLPAELRNAIYREVLVAPNEWILSGDARTQPGLLRTCRQIREEASPMFYLENTFKFDVVNLDLSDWVGFSKQWAALSKHTRTRITTRPQGVVTFSGDKYSWRNLLKALECCHQGAFKWKESEQKPRQPWQAISGAFKVVQTLRMVPWDSVVKTLEVYKKVAIDDNIPGGQWED